MKVKVDCPRCDRTEVEEDICPNCETNLFLYRMLLELPVKDTIKQNSSKKWLPIVPIKMAILSLLMGIGLTSFVHALVAGQRKPMIQNYTYSSEQVLDTAMLKTSPKFPQISLETLSEKLKETEKSPQKSCGGLYYTVQKGNSLYLLASGFYGDGNSWSHITTTNPQLRGREDLLKIGEVLLIPNLEKHC